LNRFTQQTRAFPQQLRIGEDHQLGVEGTLGKRERDIWAYAGGLSGRDGNAKTGAQP
jgi:hypothetical protein